VNFYPFVTVDRLIGHVRLTGAQSKRQCFQFDQQLPQRREGSVISQLTLRIKFRLGIRNVDVRQVHNYHVE
jgi:hypothetical protein